MTGKQPHSMVDHLFRHQYGKLVAILSKIFGLAHLELIEDAIQDTFLQASLKWREAQPDNPEAWLTQAAKNRAIDLMRQINAQKQRHEKTVHGAATLEINEYFLDHEVQDSQLRMLFVACHPGFSREEQIAFALKAISGFSMKEIAVALLQKDETIKKRLMRARKKIQELSITLDYPAPNEIDGRLSTVQQIIYLIFNEGFHSTKLNQLIDKDLCGEALRLCKLLLVKEQFRSGSLYALFGLLCFHASRLDSKIVDGKIVDLKHQDRSTWHFPLIVLGNDALNKAMLYPDRSIYHLEAGIAAEHIKAIKFENTNWQQIIDYYNEMHDLMPSDSIRLSRAITYLQMERLADAKKELDTIDAAAMSQRTYLLHGTYAEYYAKNGEPTQALAAIDKAISTCTNSLEREYLEGKKVGMGPKI